MAIISVIKGVFCFVGGLFCVGGCMKIPSSRFGCCSARRKGSNSSDTTTHSEGLESIPLLVGEDLASSNDATCAICTEGYNLQESIHLLGCGHFFHMDCYEEWRNQSKDGELTTCPMCREKEALPTVPDELKNSPSAEEEESESESDVENEQPPEPEIYSSPMLPLGNMTDGGEDLVLTDIKISLSDKNKDV